MAGLVYDRSTLELVSDKLPSAVRDEMAVPSYLHRNPAVRWLLTKRMRCVLEMLDLREGGVFLDFGCGVGSLFLQLPPRKAVYYGVDLLTWPSRIVLDAHGRRDVTLLEAANWELELPDNSLDCIAAIEVLEHVADVTLVAKALRQKLKPTGRLVVSGPTESRLYAFARRIAGFRGHYHRRNVFRITSDVERVGLASDRSMSIPMRGPGALFVISRFIKVR